MQCFCIFSAEFGITECLQNYSEDWEFYPGSFEAASDLGVPLIGVGLLYQQGYFRQYLNADGWQQERYPENDFTCCPFRRKRIKTANLFLSRVDLPGRILTRANLAGTGSARIPLFLLDTNISQNSAGRSKISPINYTAGRS